ncbi:MAG: ABC transporter permease [Bacteroidales bacterium]|nr:ABC transporter permease [Bacteroidales bacterium]
MNLKKLNIIIGREYLNKVKKKSFLFITFGVPVLFVLMYVAIIFIMLKTTDESKLVAVHDSSGIVMPTLENNDVLAYVDFTMNDVDSMKNNLKGLGADILLVISPLDSVAKTVTATTYSEKPLGMETSEIIESHINKAVENYRVNSFGIEGLDKIMSDVKSNVSLKTYTVDESGTETISESGVYMALSLILSMMLYMFIALFSGMVMTSVIEEKSSRVVEVLMSSVKSTELMFGKIIGVALVALTQFLLWIVLSGVLISIVGGIWGFDNIMGAAGTASEMTQVPGMGPSTTDLGTTMDLGTMMAEAAADTVSVAGEPTGMQAVMTTLAHLNYAEIIISFLLFFIFGYLLYASFFAAIGSAVENEADTQQLQIPVTIPLLVGFFIAFYAFKAPDSPIVFWGSMIPFTSPIVMLARIPFGVPFWQLALSLVLLILTFIVSAWASAKIYKAGILMYGKKSTFKDLWKWLKMK